MLSIQNKFSEALSSLTKANLLHTFNKNIPDRTKCAIETQLNCALEILKAAGIVESITEAGAWGLTFTPKTKIRKNNGADNNFTESAEQITETALVGRKEKLVESMKRNHGWNESDARSTMGLGPKAPDGLKGYQLAEYRHFRKSGLSEADSLRCATLPLRRPRT
jgi:hypothetical protein